MIKTIVKTTLATALLAGCGGTGLRSTATAEDDATPTTGSAAEALTVDVRVKGANTNGFSNVLLSPANVQVWADGKLLEVTQVGDLVNLATPDHAEKIATVAVPKDAQKVEFAITFGSAGGFDGTSGSGWIETRSKEIRFQSSVENLAGQNKATIEVDAAKTLVARDATTLAFVPRFRVVY